MRHIGNLPTADQGRLFRDYLYAKGIPSEIEQDADQTWMIWVAAEEQLETARALLERFRGNPAAPEFAVVAMEADRRRADQAREEEAYRKRFHTRRQLFPGTASRGVGMLTYILIAASVGVTLYSGFGADESRLQWLFISTYERGPGSFLPEVQAGQVWRLFTPVLIHLTVLHLFFNMLWLYFLGNLVEGRQGFVHFAVLTLVLGIGSNVAQYAAAGPAFGGMSGVVYGLFGYVWLRGKLDPASGYYIDPVNTVLMIVWFFLGFTGRMGIANYAHAGGLILGAVYGIVSSLRARR